MSLEKREGSYSLNTLLPAHLHRNRVQVEVLRSILAKKGKIESWLISLQIRTVSIAETDSVHNPEYLTGSIMSYL